METQKMTRSLLIKDWLPCSSVSLASIFIFIQLSIHQVQIQILQFLLVGCQNYVLAQDFLATPLHDIIRIGNDLFDFATCSLYFGPLK